MRLIDASDLIDNIVDKWARWESSYGRYIDTTVTAARDGEISTVTKQPTIVAIPVVEIEAFREMWMERAKKLGSSREGVAYLVMSYAAELILEYHDYVHQSGVQS